MNAESDQNGNRRTAYRPAGACHSGRQLEMEDLMILNEKVIRKLDGEVEAARSRIDPADPINEQLDHGAP